MKRYRLCLLAIAIGCSAVGCGSEDSVEITQGERIWAESTESIITDSESVVFDKGDMIPVVDDGQIKGYLTINYVNSIGIWDYNNVNAVTAGIKNSYSMNATLDFTDTISDAENLVVTITPSIITDGKITGTQCNVGWTGYSTTAQLYDNTKVVTVELGIQPEQAITENSLIQLDITDSAGNVYDSIFLDNEYLQAEANTHLITDDSFTIECINGARFTVGIEHVYYANRSRIDGTKIGRFYDIDYFVRYDSAPTNDREDLLFDSDNNNALHTQFVIGVTSDVDGTLLYESDPDAPRKNYADTLDWYSYVDTDFRDIQVGETAHYTINRCLPASTGNPNYVRLSFEFPEEFAARTDEEMEFFNGKYCVMQHKLEVRTLPNYYNNGGE